MDDRQQQELRRWAEQLAAAADAERRAMGRAILMLLAQIETLQAELGSHTSQPALDRPGAPTPPSGTPTSQKATGERLDAEVFDPAPSAAADSVHNAARISLRERARNLAQHVRVERRT
jgi:hypothetical protein